jgi:hypothetical protein
MIRRFVSLKRICDQVFQTGALVPLALTSSVGTLAAVLVFGGLSETFRLFLASLSALSACLATVGSQMVIWFVWAWAVSSEPSIEPAPADTRPDVPGSSLWDRELDG